ncbi:DUF992 domain-containing protein [Rhizobium sp. RAF56]|jgi:hypothetical protein|uniref:DUF992 domain-containing protein n=1 Tax=Rhizobium sp. RAF56 TaxID=3233062 RepID=UPI003F9BAE00
MKKLILIATASLIALSQAAGATTVKHNTKAEPAHQASGQPARLGSLSCTVAGGVGMVLGSSKAVDCQFARQTGKIEHYQGSIGKLGLDIGVTQKSYMRWLVYNLNATKAGEGALAGNYVGVSAGASVVVGLGANALVGGTSRNFGLQPISAETTKGLNVAAGVSHLVLRPAR